MSVRPFFDTPPGSGGLERLDVLKDPPAVDDWANVRNLVQCDLAKLDEGIRASCPLAQVTHGSNAGGGARLFVYRVYGAEAGSDIDPVVVGVVVETISSGTTQAFRVRGDIAGETLGDILFALPEREVIGWVAMVNVAREMGKALASEPVPVLAALRDRSRQD